MTRSVPAGLIVLLSALFLLGCSAGTVAPTTTPNGSSSAASAATPATATTAPTVETSPSAASPAPSEASPTAAKPAVDQAKQDLAKQESISADQIKVVEVTSVEWPTSALGCPQPGRLYSQLVTPGYRIILETGGQTYEYHSGRGQRVVYCANP